MAERVTSTRFPMSGDGLVTLQNSPWKQTSRMGSQCQWRPIKTWVPFAVYWLNSRHA